jgi:hypothetical protein
MGISSPILLRSSLSSFTYTVSADADMTSMLTEVVHTHKIALANETLLPGRATYFEYASIGAAPADAICR